MGLREIDPGDRKYRERKGGGFRKFLAIMIIMLALALALGTVYALVTDSRSKMEKASLSSDDGGSDIFDLGQVRAKSSDIAPAFIAARISFPYPSASASFREELERKAPALRSAASAFFSGHTVASLLPANERAIKDGLRDTFNSLLSLGRLAEIWLSDFAVVQ
jgi:flagellar basal body-associated protein FliL